MQIDTFLARWRAAGGSERANYQLFIADLCALLEVDRPQPANEDTRNNPYVFERRVVFHHGDGSTSNGFIDCYKRGSFIGEAKKIRAGAETRQFDDALLRARGQAENYARHLPADEGRPPFLVVLDVGNVIELYAEFTCTGGSYTPFPDPRSHRIRLDDLNAERAAEEAAGHIRWLRPDFQNPNATVGPQKQAKMDLPATTAPAARSTEKHPWPATLPEQVRAIADVLTATPQDEPALAARFTGKGPWKKRLPEILAMLAALGRAKQSDGGWVG